uniref:Uncharacterized protein n=1 Tax=Oryza rufipogon TaxID=4529 RepID=A0A0E0NS37_ORYRU
MTPSRICQKLYRLLGLKCESVKAPERDSLSVGSRKVMGRARDRAVKASQLSCCIAAPATN